MQMDTAQLVEKWRAEAMRLRDEARFCESPTDAAECRAAAQALAVCAVELEKAIIEAHTDRPALDDPARARTGNRHRLFKGER